MSINLKMLEVLGGSYLTQHFLQEIKRRRRRRALETYITDALYCIGNNKRMKERFADLFPDTETANADDRSGEEIINDIVRKFAETE